MRLSPKTGLDPTIEVKPITETHTINEDEVIGLYTFEKMTLRMVAEEMGTDHHRIKRILVKNGIEITRKDRIRKPMTDEHKAKISKATKGRTPWSKGKKMSKEAKLKNMVAHIKYDVDLEFYQQFDDIEKLKCLNKMLTRDRVSKHFDTQKYKSFITKFYNDEQFNAVYQKWIDSNGDKWAAPSLDHIHPISKGGGYELDNLQILTWFENRTKSDMTNDEWQEFKLKTKTTSTYFIGVDKEVNSIV